MPQKPGTSGSFLRGLLIGLGLGVATTVTPVLLLGGEAAAALAMGLPRLALQLQGLATTNLQGSILPFGAVLLFYLWQWRALGNELRQSPACVERISRLDQLLELCASLFFGIGVVWTAIGMRDAMLNSLGGNALADSAGAFSVLQRLIEGGILTALSTTIVGSIGGYLMRVAKSLAHGDALNALYLAASERALRDNNATLVRIERLLAETAHPDRTT